MNILVINTGSTSVKLAVMAVNDDRSRAIHTARYQAYAQDADALLQEFLSGATPPDACVHRVVHGGDDLVDSRVIDAGIVSAIEALASLAPLHNPVALSWIRACGRQLKVPQVAVFDTAFFNSMPDVAKSYAIPSDRAEVSGIRRYGFHGIAHRAMWQRWCELRPDLPAGGKLISIQLGGGCSITAIQNGVPQDTSMGFSPAEGLVMATRCGDIDAGAIVHLIRNKGMTAEMVEQLINTQSGLLGLSGKSADMQDLIDSPAARSRLAVDMYCYRLKKYIGAYQAALGGADGIVFGGGVGEHMPQVRARTLADMQWCGIEIDATANQRAQGDEMQISGTGSRVDIRVLPVDEAAILVSEARQALQREGVFI